MVTAAQALTLYKLGLGPKPKAPVAAPTTTAEREAVRQRAVTAGKKPTTAGINATVAKNRATADAAARAAALTAAAAAAAAGNQVVGPAPGDLPAGSEGLVLSGPTQAGVAAGEAAERKRMEALRKARQAAGSGATSGTSAPASGVGVDQPAPQDDQERLRKLAAAAAGASSGPTPNASAYENANEQARFKRGANAHKSRRRRRNKNPDVFFSDPFGTIPGVM